MAGRRTEVQVPKKWTHTTSNSSSREIISPDRTKVWIEPKPKPKMDVRKVPVVYYLSKDGHLEHPHFIEVPLSSNDGLYLKDVINRLNSLRGKGMASLYSWSSKRSYKNGFVWHDLSDNDFIYPAQGHEYILKGSEFLETNISFRSDEIASPSSEKLPETNKSGENIEFPVVIQRRNQSWSSIDLHEYKVYKNESTGEYAGKAADAATQTEEKRRRRRMIKEEEEEEETEEEVKKSTSFDEEQYENHTTELSREEISPPPSSSSPETLESLIKSNGRISSTNNSSTIINESDIRNLTANNHPSGRVKASVVLKQLISCGSFSVKEDGSTSTNTNTPKRDQGFSLMSHYRGRLPHEVANHVGSIGNQRFEEIGLEDKEFFSGSLMETKKDEFSAFKRSSSCNSNKNSNLVLEKPKNTSSTKKEGEENISTTGSKRFTDGTFH